MIFNVTDLFQGRNHAVSLPYNAGSLSNARRLRKNMTPQECHLWYDFFRAYPVRFQRQRPIEQYIVDFYCHKAKLVVEIDGSQHYTEAESARDAARTEQLQKFGLTVIRVANSEVNEEFEGVCQYIHNTVTELLGYEPRF